MMTFSQILALSFPDLEKEIQKEENELLELTMAIRLRQEKNTAKKRKARKHLARLKAARHQKSSETLSHSHS